MYNILESEVVIMLINRFQNFINTKINLYSSYKLEKFILKALFKANIGPESLGISDINLKSNSSIMNVVRYNNSKSFNKAMDNLYFKGLIEYQSNNNTYETIKLTSTGLEFYTKNQLFIKQLLITSFISGLFSIFISVVTNLLLNN